MFKTVVKIDGMQCGMCESHINDCIRNNFRIKKVTSSRTKGETVILSEQALDEEKIRELIVGTGYSVCGISTEVQQPKKKLFHFGSTE